MRALVLATLMCVAANQALSQDAYLCVSDGAAGIGYSAATKRWSATTFDVAGKRYIFRRPKESETFRGKVVKWGLYEFGKDTISTPCFEDFNSSNLISCYWTTYFLFNRDNLRFQSFYTLGYVVPAPNQEGADTPNIEFGHCSPS
jgi:hypothetical protein